VSKNHTSLRAHIHTRCSPRLLIRPVTLSLQIDTSSVHRPTRTLHPCYQASRRVSPPHLLQSPARLSATQEADPTAPTCDVTCTRYKLISHNHSLHALPFFTHPFQTPLKIHLRLTSPNPTLWYYRVLLNKNILHVYLLFVIYYFVIHYCYCERWGSHNA